MNKRIRRQLLGPEVRATAYALVGVALGIVVLMAFGQAWHEARTYDPLATEAARGQSAGAPSEPAPRHVPPAEITFPFY